MMLFLFLQAAAPLPAIACAPGVRDERHASVGLHVAAAPLDPVAPTAEPNTQCRVNGVKKPEGVTLPVSKAERKAYTA